MTTQRSLILQSGFALFLVLFAHGVSTTHATTKSDAASVLVAAESVATGESLTLGDIAEVKADDADFSNRLRAIPLGYAPDVGAVRELSRERITMAIAAAGFAKQTIKLEAPSIALVRRAAQVVDHALIQEAVENAALAGLRADGATARLSRLDVPSLLEVPSGTVEVRAQVGGVKNLFAPFIVSIECHVDGRVARRFSATAQVEAFAPVLVAASDMAANTRLRPENVRLEVRRLEHAPATYLRDIERLRGLSTQHTVMHGEPVTTDALVAEIIIKPGDAVRIVGDSGALNIAVAGEARAAGRIGDRIQVKNIQSGALLQATVIDEGLVRVRF